MENPHANPGVPMLEHDLQMVALAHVNLQEGISYQGDGISKPQILVMFESGMVFIMALPHYHIGHGS